MNNTMRNKQRGFTLVELLVAVTLMVILIGAIVLIFDRSTKIFTTSEANMTVMQNVRVAFDSMAKELAGAQAGSIAAIPTSTADTQTLLTFQSIISVEDVTGLGTIEYLIIAVNNSNNQRWRLFRKFSLEKPDGTTLAGQDILCQFIHAPRNGVAPGIDFAIATFLKDENRWKIPATADDITSGGVGAVRVKMDVTDIKTRLVRTVSRIFWIATAAN